MQLAGLQGRGASVRVLLLLLFFCSSWVLVASKPQPVQVRAVEALPSGAEHHHQHHYYRRSLDDDDDDGAGLLGGGPRPSSPSSRRLVRSAPDLNLDVSPKDAYGSTVRSHGASGPFSGSKPKAEEDLEAQDTQESCEWKGFSATLKQLRESEEYQKSLSAWEFTADITPVVRQTEDIIAFFASPEKRRKFVAFFKKWFDRTPFAMIGLGALTWLLEGFLGDWLLHEAMAELDAQSGVPPLLGCVVASIWMATSPSFSYADKLDWQSKQFPVMETVTSSTLIYVMLNTFWKQSYTLGLHGYEGVENYLPAALTHFGFGMVNVMQGLLLKYAILGYWTAPDGNLSTTLGMIWLDVKDGMRKVLWLAVQVVRSIASVLGIKTWHSTPMPRRTLNPKFFKRYYPINPEIKTMIEQNKLEAEVKSDTDNYLEIASEIAQMTRSDWGRKYVSEAQAGVREAVRKQDDKLVPGYHMISQENLAKIAHLRDMNGLFTAIAADAVPNFVMALLFFSFYFAGIRKSAIVDKAVFWISQLFAGHFTSQGALELAHSMSTYNSGGEVKQTLDEWLEEELDGGSLKKYGDEGVTIKTWTTQARWDDAVIWKGRFVVQDCEKCIDTHPGHTEHKAELVRALTAKARELKIQQGAPMAIIKNGDTEELVTDMVSFAWPKRNSGKLRRRRAAGAAAHAKLSRRDRETVEFLETFFPTYASNGKHIDEGTYADGLHSVENPGCS